MNILLIETDSKILLDEEIAKRTKNYETITFNLLESSIEDIITNALYTSLFDEKRAIIVKNANFFANEKLSSSEEKKLLEYFSHPNPLVLLIFTTYEKVDKRKSITKALIKENLYLCLESPKGYELTNKTRELITKKGYKIKDDALKYLIMCSINSWDLIYNEILKFSLCFKPNTMIEKKDLQQIISINKEENNFKFIDAVINKNISATYTILEDSEQMKVEPLVLIRLLYREFRLMFMVKLYEKKNISYAEMLKDLGLSDWQLKKIIQNSSNYSYDDLKDYIVSLSQIDYQIKSGKMDKNLALYLFLVSFFEY